MQRWTDFLSGSYPFNLFSNYQIWGLGVQRRDFAWIYTILGCETDLCNLKPCWNCIPCKGCIKHMWNPVRIFPTVAIWLCPVRGSTGSKGRSYAGSWNVPSLNQRSCIILGVSGIWPIISCLGTHQGLLLFFPYCWTASRLTKPGLLQHVVLSLSRLTLCHQSARWLSG